MAMAGGGGGGGSAGAIRAGGAFVDLASKDEKLRSGLARARAMVQSFARVTMGAGTAMAAAGAAMLTPLVPILQSGISKAGNLNDLATIFGMTVEQASRMAYAFEVTGNSADDMKKALQQVAKQGFGGPIDQQLFQTVEALLAIEDGATRAAAAQEIFGRNWFQVLDTAGDLPRLMAEAPVITADLAKKSEELEQQWNKIRPALEAALLPFVDMLLPAITAVSEFVRENAELVRVLAVVGSVLVVAGGAMIALGATITAVTTIATAATAVWGALTAAVTFFLTPVGLIIVAVAAVAAGLVALVAFTETGRAAFRSLSETFLAAWGGIVDALAKGDFSLAAAIAWEAVKVVWAKGVSWITGQWNSFKDEIVGGWMEFAEAAEFAWEKIKGITNSKEANDAAIAALRARTEAERQVRAAARAADKLESEEDVRAAEERMHALIARAAANRVAQKKAGDEQIKSVARQAQSMFSIASTIGAFGGAGAGQMFGAMTSPLVSTIANATRATAANTKGILAELKKDGGEAVFD